MKGISVFKSRSGSFILIAVLSMLTLGQIPTHAATDCARVVKYAQNDIVPIKGLGGQAFRSFLESMK